MKLVWQVVFYTVHYKRKFVRNKIEEVMGIVNGLNYILTKWLRIRLIFRVF